MDATSLALLNKLHPKIKDDAILAWTECQTQLLDHPNVHIVVNQSYRSFAESDALYALGRTVVNHDGQSATKPMGNKVSNSKAGQSYHNYALAFDFQMITNGHLDWSVGPLWKRVVATMKSHGWTWGGDFTTIYDAPHFEKTLGHKWKDLLVKHNNGDFIPGTVFVNI